MELFYKKYCKKGKYLFGFRLVIGCLLDGLCRLDKILFRLYILERSDVCNRIVVFRIRRNLVITYHHLGYDNCHKLLIRLS